MRAKRNWYSERSRLLQEIATDQPKNTNIIHISFKKLEGEKSVLILRDYYDGMRRKMLSIPMSDESLSFTMLNEWLSYINTAWFCGSASVTIENGDQKYTLSLEPVIYKDKRNFKYIETAYFYVYSSRQKRIVMSAFIDLLIFFDNFDCMMNKFIKEHNIFDIDNNAKDQENITK